ncbi:MAG: hypothetical protein KGJ31_02400, partial [Patescibacteria group bacterium]|nr:hypothetical protein [Patescibacteria group bacterium]
RVCPSKEKHMLLPEKSPYVSSETSMFDTLVRAGEEKALITLPIQLHGFLVGCLAEHVRDPEIVHQVLALSILYSTTKQGEQGDLLLKRAGDEALLLAGFYPERALRLRVSSSYFRFMGQTAYANLAARFQATGKTERGKFYAKVAKHFRLLEKVLGGARARPETDWDAFQRFKIRLL